MKRLLLAGACVIGMWGHASATGTYSLNGAGKQSCAAWVESTKEKTADGKIISWDGWEYIQWVAGFLSGVGWTGRLDPLNGVDLQAMVTWTTSYCKANPLDNLGTAAAAFAYAHPR